jgi:AbrB family looped-hinge helix DNA binding protein
METLATTRMSSKGQVVIPESIRKQLNLQEGAQFVVVGNADVVILKVVVPPDMGEFDALIQLESRQRKQV